MQKVQLVIDFDDTLVNADLRLRQMYSKQFGVVLPDEITDWEGSKSLPLAPNGWVTQQFNNPYFFDNLTFMKHAISTLQRLKSTELFHMVLCTIASPQNAKLKVEFFQNTMLHILFDEIVINVKYGSCHPSKSFIDYNSIVVDDHQNNLKTCKTPILFQSGVWKEWNNGYRGRVAYCWNQVQRLIMEEHAVRQSILKHRKKLDESFTKKMKCGII